MLSCTIRFTLCLLAVAIAVEPSHGFQMTQQAPSSILFASSGDASQATTSFRTAAATKTTKRTYPDDVILYDGVCNFCNAWVDILLRIDVAKKFRFAPLQSRVGRDLLVAMGKEADDISSVVLVKAAAGAPAAAYTKSECVLQVVQELGPLAKVASQAALALVPEHLRDTIYDVVAENRYSLLGKREECRCSDPEFADRFLID